MNISYNWLKRYIDTDLGAEEVARILTDIGLEVEGFEKIETVKGGLAGVVVGEVLSCEDHPDSDHLHVTTVDVGTGEPLQIVCGAPNCRAGLKVLCATVGTVLYPGGGDEEFKIKRSKIRGVESLGMLCAEDELGIGASHDGIMELPADAVAGTTARDYLRIEDDYLIEVGLTPNRVDAASHIGVARDLAAYLRSRGEDVSVKMPDVSAFAPDNHDLGVKIRVENHEAAPRYAGVTVKNCKIAPSPEWMQNCLRAAGINPKNNLVDITNFVLFELGQPLHAFDAAKIEGREVVVRTCAEGTPFVTLDGVERKLTADDLMICSAERPMCIAGVFGGLDSGISDTTTDVFIESAYFNPVWVRKTAKRFGLNTIAVAFIFLIVAVLMVGFTESDFAGFKSIQQNNDLSYQYFTKKDLRHSWFMWHWFCESCYNYERMQGLGFCTAMIPLLRKIYKGDDEAMIAAMKRQSMFFNTDHDFGGMILGICASMEEQKRSGADIPDEAFVALKSGLMGPCAGIGDTLSQVVLLPVLSVIFINLATQGAVWAPIAYTVLFMAIFYGVGYWMLNIGYKSGGEAVLKLMESGIFDKVVKVANILGCAVCGALICSYVSFNWNVVMMREGVEVFNLQTGVFDAILPNMMPLLLTMGVYGLSKKGVKSSYITFGTMLLGFVLGLLGVIA